MYPGIRAWHKWIREQLSKNRTLVNCYGRKRVFLNRWGDELFKTAYNYIPQSTVADKINREGLLLLLRDKILNEVELLNQVHDAIYVQIPISAGFQYHADCINIIRNSLEKPVKWRNTEFIIPVDVKIGFNMKPKITLKTRADNLKYEIKEAYEKLINQDK